MKQQKNEVYVSHWIKHRNHTQKSISEPFVNVDPKETEDQARALSNETGLIIVSDFITR
jgi:hypothetical protein